MRQEALALRALLERERPDWAALIGAPAAPLIPSSLVSQFWHAFGWCEGFEPYFGIVEPNASRVYAAQRLAAYRSDSDEFSITLSDLPATFSIVQLDPQGFGFLLTDDLLAHADPAVLSITEDSTAIDHSAPSTLRWVACLVAQFATQLLSSSRAIVAAMPHETAIAPQLVPSLRLLADGVYRVPNSVLPSDETQRLAWRSYDALVAWGLDAPFATLALPDVPWTVVAPERGARLIAALAPWRDLGDGVRIGRYDGIAVAVRAQGTKVAIATDTAEQDRLLRQLA